MTILAVYREPFSLAAPRVARLPEGRTLAQLVASMPGLPHDFETRGVICINGHPTPRALWGAITPKPAAVTEVTFHASPMGGGDNGKNPLAIIASIALTVATGFIAGGGFATSAGWFAKGTVSALALAGGVSLVGSLILSALIAPPVQQQQDAPSPLKTASVDGNRLEPGGTLPRVIGERKLYPPFAQAPLVYYDGSDEVVEALFALAGPHRLTDIQLGGSAIADIAGVSYETREGWAGDLPLELVTRQSRTEAAQVELRGHTVKDDGVTLDVTAGSLGDALPQSQKVVGGDEPDEMLVQLFFPQGLINTAAQTNNMRLPIRLRIRDVASGGAWINLPELHFQAHSIRQIRATVRLVWTSDATTSPGAAQAEGWSEARHSSPGQTAQPASADWTADSYFDTGSGDDWLDSNNIGTTGVDHVIMDRFTATIYLDEATFPKGRYEVELTRGFAYNRANWSPSAYTISGTVWNLYGYAGVTPAIGYSRASVADTIYLQRLVSIWNELPVGEDGMALIAIKARNVAVQKLSVVAGGYVRDWDGSAWSTWSVTDNPAPHLRDIWAGQLNAKPVPVSLIDDDGLVTWRAACAANSWKCNAVIESGSVMDAATIVAACGYARPYMSEIWGVVRDYDRSAEDPVQIFSPRNSQGLQFTKALPDLPTGLRVNFRDQTRDYDTHQVTVLADGEISDDGLIEEVTFEGVVTEAEVRALAAYHLRQPRYRGAYYTFDAPAEALRCRKGSLVGVNSDVLISRQGAARVVDWTVDGFGDVTEIVLDDTVPVFNEPDVHAVTDMHAVSDVHMLGLASGVSIRRAGSITTHPLNVTTGETDTLTLASPISASGLVEGALCAIGVTGKEVGRYIVNAIQPRADFTATLTLIDEAPEVFA